jgi:hypothetical protein
MLREFLYCRKCDIKEKKARAKDKGVPESFEREYVFNLLNNDLSLTQKKNLVG